MAKIKVTEKETEIEGTIEEGRVTPFGTSAHISVGKKHTGKKVNVVIPTKPMYIWLISKTERATLLKIAKKNIQKANGKMEHFRLGLIKELEQDTFNIYSLSKVLTFVPVSSLSSKVKKLYNL